MKVFIRDFATRKCLFSAGGWTDDTNEALDFERPERAFHFCKLHELQDVEVIVKGRDKEQVFAVRSKEAHPFGPPSKLQFANKGVG